MDGGVHLITHVSRVMGILNFSANHEAKTETSISSIFQVTDPPGPDGTITLTFTDCSSSLVEYNITSINKQGSVPIKRVANDNIVLCESLSGD
ncbi:hypothetical protein ACFL1J_02570 [Pseudomonadota bacterium]|jgi:hypothetical protein